MNTRPPWWLTPVLVGGTFGLLLWWEWKRPLRRSVESKLRRTGRNLAVATLTAATVQAIERPLVMPLAQHIESNRMGFIHIINLPTWLRWTLAIVLMDYTLYLWHVLTHRVPFLWRFHRVHHVDLDLDTSTALRFHCGEFALSVGWRAGQVLILGVGPGPLILWQILTLLEVMFHHSNVELPMGLERWLCRLLVTPRMHGIHHSMVPEETNSNWSSGLTLWDWLHGTLRLNVHQDEVVIGIPAYRDPGEVTLPRVLIMPFGPQRPSWQIPGDGVPQREPVATPSAQLLP